MSRLAKSFALLLSFAGLLLGATNANAAACTAIASTAWNVQTTWGAAGTGCVGATGGIPGAADTVTVPTTFTVTVTAAAAAASLTVNGTGSVVNNSTLTISGALGGTGGLTNGTAASVLDIGGNSTITTLTATFAGNTVNYTGAAQTAKVTTYSNLTLSGSLAKTFATNPTVNGVLSMEGAATVTVTTGVVTYGAAATLQYNKPAAYTTTLEEWPATFAATGGVIIKNTGVITLNANKVLSNGVPLTIDLGATLANATRALNVGGNLTVNGTLTGSSGAITLSGTARTIDGTGSIIATSTGTLLITTSRTILNTANLTIASPTTLSAATTVTNNGIINKTTTAALNGANATTSIWVNAAGSTLNYAGTNAPMATGVLTASAANTVNYNGAAQTVEVPSGAPATYYHLTFSGSGVKTMPATAMTVTGDFTMSGAAGTSATAAAALTVGGNFSIGTGNTFANGTNALNVAGNFDQSGTFTAGAGVVTLNGGAAVQTISGVGALGFANLTINNTGGITLARNVTVISAIIGAHTLTSTCPTDWTLISNGGATVEHSCAASVVSINCSVSCAATSAATVSWTVIFNNSVTGVTSGNFTLVNVGLGGTPAITLVSGGGTTWTVTASTGTGTGTLELDMANATGVTPTVTNLPFTGQVYSIVGAGVINTYYPGTASVSAGATSITLGAATGAATPIAIGDMLLIIQMQDATIDSTNTATYGTVSGTPTAGKYEYVLAASAVGVGGGTLTLSCGTLNAYTDANYVAGSSGQKRFQVIRVPVYASYTINAITASAWNGSTGGVLAFDVTGALNLNTATVDVSGTGFRGGASRMLVGPGATGANADYRTLATVNNNASKGEGIAGTPFYVFTAPSTLTNTAVEGYPNGSHARGAPANAGGGGTDLDPPINDMNPGGGGGANGGAGGGGGLAWCPTFNAGAPPLYGCGPYSGGLGGIPVAGLGATRLTLGGGGGGGTTNNGTGTLGNGLNSSGAAGGGIIMLRTGSMTGAATFNANGSDGDSTIRNDGSGGGGAGGVVLISTGSGMGGVTINVNGGNGGSNLVPPGTTSPPHGPGGGGGGGYAITTGAPAASSAAAGANGVTYNVGVLFGAYGATAGSAGSSNSGLTASAIPGVALGAASCTAPLDHLEIQHASGTGLTCAASTLTIKACTDAAVPCVTPYTSGVSGTLTPPTVNWDGTTGGAAGAGFVIPVGGSSVTKNVQVATAGSVVFGVSSAAPAPTNATTCNFGSPLCTFTASLAGFIFSDTTTGNVYTIPAQVSGIATPTLYLRAVQASTTNPAVCTPAIVGQTTAVNMGYVCNNPVACQAGNLATITNTITSTATAIAPGGTSVSLNFDANGSAPITARYDDVGQITLNANKTVTPFGGGTAVTLNGTSNAFVVKPHHFDLTGIQQTAAPNLVNPAAASAAGAKFVKAGEQFSVTVTARNFANAATPNYGQESTAESVRFVDTSLLPADPNYANHGTLVAPAGGINPAVSGTFGAFTGGVATGTNFTWDEAGIITLTPSILSGNYLGVAGDTTGTASGNVGRFYPDHFAITSSPIAAACSTGTAFTYFGQDGFTTTFTLTAQGVAPTNATTANYIGAGTAATWAKLPLTTWGAAPASAGSPGFGFAASAWAPSQPAGSSLAASATAPTATNSNTWSGGTTTVTAMHQIVRPTAAAAPTTVTVTTLPVDSDGVTATSAAAIGSPLLRFGRLRLIAGQGSELAPFLMQTETQYYDGIYWRTNTDDSCTTYAFGNASASGTTGTSISTANAIRSGYGSLLLTRPTASGIATICLDMASTADGCTGSPAASLGYLRGNWGAATYDRDPSATVLFGGANSNSRGNWGFLYRRENF